MVPPIWLKQIRKLVSESPQFPNANWAMTPYVSSFGRVGEETEAGERRGEEEEEEEEEVVEAGSVGVIEGAAGVEQEEEGVSTRAPPQLTADWSVSTANE